MKYTVKPTSKFQKDLKRIQKRGFLYLTRTGSHSDLF